MTMHIPTRLLPFRIPSICYLSPAPNILNRPSIRNCASSQLLSWPTHDFYRRSPAHGILRQNAAGTMVQRMVMLVEMEAVVRRLSSRLLAANFHTWSRSSWILWLAEYAAAASASIPRCLGHLGTRLWSFWRRVPTNDGLSVLC